MGWPVPAVDPAPLPAYLPAVESSSPRVTIEGGPGWQVDEAAPDVIGTDPGRGSRRRPSRALVAAVAVSALLGFAAATVLAELRHDRVGEIDAATLSVSVWEVGEFGDERPVTVQDRTAGVRIPFQLANTGPRAIQLLSVGLQGTDIRTDDLAGRRLAPGRWARLSLVRPLDCGAEPRQIAVEGDVARLVVRARTDAGVREVQVRATLRTGLLSREMLIALCGDLPPDEALFSELAETSYAERGVALLSLRVANGSRHPITVERVGVIVPWLSARLVDEQGRAVQLPLTLPAGDFSSPRQPWEPRDSRAWRVEISVPDCREVPEDIPVDYEPLLVVDVDSGERAGTARLGGDVQSVARELVRSAC